MEPKSISKSDLESILRSHATPAGRIMNDFMQHLAQHYDFSAFKTLQFIPDVKNLAVNFPGIDSVDVVRITEHGKLDDRFVFSTPAGRVEYEVRKFAVLVRMINLFG